jgi:hypothetical protein
MREARIITALRENGPCTAKRLAEILQVGQDRVRIYICQNRFRIIKTEKAGRLNEYSLLEHPITSESVESP